MISTSDVFFFIWWWGILFFVGVSFFPFTHNIFSFSVDKGYPFAKIIGVLIISYIIFVLGSLIIPFTYTSTILITIIVSYIFFSSFSFKEGIFHFDKSSLLLFKKNWKLLFLEEVIFFICLYFWAFIRTHQPDIYGLEKYMDFGFVNSILRSSFFPPKDMWFTPYSINYYYFGHFITAVLTKISNIPSYITYNLMLATLFSFCFTLTFSITLNLFTLAQQANGIKKQLLRNKIFVFIFSIITASLISLGGNLHILYMFFSPYNTDNPVPFTKLSFLLQSVPNGYWYPNATRFIYNTIHEFPLYSFVVSDLHGHVVSIPIVLTILFFLFSLYSKKKVTFWSLVFISFLLSTAYMTNAWDGAIYLLLTILVIITILIQNVRRQKKTSWNISIKLLFHDKDLIISILYYSMITVACFFLFSLPFSLHFKPFVGGIGVLCAPKFLIEMQRIGPLLFEADHCQKSPFWQLMILHGFYYFFIFSFFIFLLNVKKKLTTDFFIILLILTGTVLILLPEFIYLKDIYPAHYRANTMFKLVYQAFILLSIVSGYALFRILQNIPYIKSPFGRIGILYFISFAFIFIVLVLYYPVTAIRSYYEDLSNRKSLDGIAYLKKLHPDDYKAILWINSNISGQPVIVEAQGDSYTDYERISSNTGLPTILGWTVHEWLWRGSYEIPAPRIAEVQILYETKDIHQTKKIIQKYNISYIYIGDLERKKYPKIFEDKFATLGKVIYQSGNTKIYSITGFLQQE